MAVKTPQAQFTRTATIEVINKVFDRDYTMVAEEFDRIMMRMLSPDDHLDARDRNALATLYMLTCEMRKLAKEAAHV